MAYYYVKRGYFKDEYMVGAPFKIPDKIINLFVELREFSKPLDVWLESHMT